MNELYKDMGKKIDENNDKIGKFDKIILKSYKGLLGAKNIFNSFA